MYSSSTYSSTEIEISPFKKIDKKKILEEVLADLPGTRFKQGPVTCPRGGEEHFLLAYPFSPEVADPIRSSKESYWDTLTLPSRFLDRTLSLPNCLS